MTAIFFSDVHLRDADSVKTKLVIRFLQEVASRFDQIYILGDLFDVWPGTTEYLVQKYKPVLQTLKSLVDDGNAVHYLEGNHDFRLGHYFKKDLGISVYTDSIEENWNGKKIFMAHGDLGNPRQLGYRALRFVLRQDVLHLALKAFPQRVVYNVAARTSNASRDYQTRIPRAETAIRQIYRQAAERMFRKGYDYVLMGHTHLPDDVTTLVEGRQCRYINLGDWMRNFTYLEFDGSNFYTKTHPVKDL